MWHLSSRVHKLNHFPHQEVSCYVKRDDELGCGISGSKMRKYASLIPYLLQEKIEHLIIIAGPQSNNLLAALQLAREFQFKITVFLLQPHHTEVQGNFKLSLLFLQEEEIHWIRREDWSAVNELATLYLNKCKETGFILNEGASVAEAMPGAMSLADDIINNEQELNLKFDHIFIDAGTGFSAAGLIKRMAQVKHQAMIHVLLLADNELVFRSKLESWLGLKTDNYQCITPTTAKSFGALNQTIKKEIKRIACEEGILVEPIYSAKLFYEARQVIVTQHLKGNVLIIHTGGLLTMAGFDFKV